MSDTTDDHRVIAPVPRITIQAFCETADIADAIQAAAGDRRMQKAHVKVQMGGAPAAVEAYRNAPTPNVILIEADRDRPAILGYLDTLAEFCDAGTKVVVVGHVNDVILYRELMRRGISEYLIAPVAVLDFVRTTSELFSGPSADPVGRTIAVVGAKGGVGASTVAHNLAWAIGQGLGAPTAIADLDIAFGTAGLDFNQDPPQGIAEAVFAPDRLDGNLVDRLLSKCSDNLSLLAAPAVLDRTADLTESALDGLIDILRGMIPNIVLDVPHLWTAWAKRMLISADEIAIVAAPELASLRNAKNLFELLRQSRPNDRKPKVILNQVGVPKRPEISAAEFAKALGTELAAVLPFDAQLFGTAANNGQMIAEVQPSGKAAETFADLAAAITGRAEPKRSRVSFLDPILAKLARRKAS
ncbi:MAG: CpaE family protein [Xanthobacteraceae bacterium]|jgi:pilus assembly protein CpaE